MTTFLPYYCPTFRTEHFLKPCTANQTRAMALMAAKKHLGPLEKCVECKGTKLELRVEPPVDLQVGAIDPDVEVTRKPNWPEMKAPTEDTERKPGHNLGKKYKKRAKIAPVLPNGVVAGHDHGEFVPFEPKKASDIVQVKPEVLEQRILEGKVPPKQEEPVAVKLSVAEAEKALGKDRVDKIMKPELDLGPGDIIQTPKPGEVIPYKPGDINDPALRLEIHPAMYCRTPGHEMIVAKRDKIGRWMGFCPNCLSARGRKAGIANHIGGLTAAPMTIPINLPEYADLKAWLMEQAKENERTFPREIMYRLKMAMRQAEPERQVV